MSPGLTVLAFAASAAAVIAAGVMLTRHGDVIAARTNLGGLWVGTVFLAVATSLPELTTDIAAVRLGVPDLAAGDLFGSSMANMLILAIVSLAPGRELFRKSALDGVLSAALATTLTGIAAIFLLLRLDWTFAGFGAGSITLLITYLVGTRLIFQHTTVAQRAARQTELAGEPPPDLPDGLPTLRRALFGFGAGALIILIAAPVFASAAKGVAELTGISASFVGTVLVGLSTSLPELVTSLAAVRRNAYDLAVGNLFGSNAVNMVMVVPLDAAQPGASFLAVVSSVHVISALVAMILMQIALTGIVYRAKGRFSMLEPSGLLMLIIYLLGLALVFVQGNVP